MKQYKYEYLDLTFINHFALKLNTTMDVDEKPTIVKKGCGVNMIYRGHCHKKDRVSAGKQLWRCIKA